MKKSLKVCPKCKLIYSESPAISRRDNKTEICSECGTKEALKDFDDYIKRLKGDDTDE